MIRREAYRRVRDALADAGIHFAHREVRVRLPEGHSGGEINLDSAELRRSVGGAAAEGAVADEARRHGKIDYDNEM